MHKNQNQFQSTPQIQQNYFNKSQNYQSHQDKYGNLQQDQIRNQPRQPANSNQNMQGVIKQNNNFLSPTSYQLQGVNNVQNNQYQKQGQYDDQEEYSQDNQGQNSQLNHTFSEDSNNENSQVTYPSDNKENSITNQRQKGLQSEIERGGGNNNYNYSSEQQQYGQQFNYEQNQQERNSKKKRTLAIITLDVGGGNSDVIEVMEGDDLKILAKNFCNKHSLDEDCIQYIIKNIQSQLDKRKQKRKEKPNDLSNNVSQANNQLNKNTQQFSNTGKDNNFRISSESPKFPGLQQSYQGSLQNNFMLNQQGQKQSGNFKQTQQSNQIINEDENAKKKRPQQPSFGQNPFFEQSSPQKQKTQYEQINEEEYEDQSISVIGQSANISMPEENYEYQSTNRYQAKPQSKNQMMQQNQVFEKDIIPQKNNFLSPPQINKIGAQQINSPSSAGSQYTNNNRNMQNIKSPGQIFPNRGQQIDNKFNSINNYKDESENFQDQFGQQVSKNKQQLQGDQDILDYEEFKPNYQKQNFQNQQQQPNMQLTASFNQNQKSQAQYQNLNIQKQQTQIGTKIQMGQHDDNDFEGQKEQRKKAIEQVSQNLNLESKKPNIQPSPSQPQKIRQASNLNQNTNSHSKKQSKGKISNRLQQLNAQKEQFFNSYNSQTNNQHKQDDEDQIENYIAYENPNMSHSDLDSPQKQNKYNQNLSKEQQFESPQRHLRKSYSNNNIQQYENNSLEKHKDSKQSYEQWSKAINQKVNNGQKVNLKVKRVSGNSNVLANPNNQGKSFQIQNTQPNVYSNQKKSQVLTNQNMGSNTSISPKSLNKNKSATQLNKLSNSSMINLSQNFHQQAQSQSQINVHQKLYFQGMDQMERRKLINEDHQEKFKDKEIKGSTFHPSISPQSRNMKLQDGVKLEDYLILEGRKNKERKAIAALVKEEENNQEYRFKPQVSIVSQKLAEHQQSQNESNFSSIHDRLYYQGLNDISSKDEWSTQQFYNIYPFNPDLGVNKDRKIPEKNQKDFTERLIAEKQVKEAKLLVQRSKQNDFIDKQTGQKLFHPQINKDEVHYKVSSRVDLQDKLIEDELKTRSISPMNSVNKKQGRDVKPPRIKQLQWDELLRSNREHDHYDLQKINDNKGRSVTPRNMKITRDFDDTNYAPLSSRAANSTLSANQEIENILNQSSFRNKKVLIKSSQNKDMSQDIPVINLSKKNTLNTSNNYHASMVNQTKFNKNSSTVMVGNNNYTTMNNMNLSNTNRSKSQINLNHTQLQLSAISQFDNNKIFNDHKLSEKIALIFDQFDSDGDGKINAHNIDISTTEPEILEIIQNVLFEIDGKNLTLNRNQFTQLLCSNNLIIPLKRYYAEQEGEVCDEDMTDYDLIRSNISAINFNNTYLDNTHLNYTNASNINTNQIQQQQQLQQYDDYNQKPPQIPVKQNSNNPQYLQQSMAQNNTIIYSNNITNTIINNMNNNRNSNLSKKSSKNN